MKTRANARRLSTIAAAGVLLSATSAMAVPGDLTDYFNDGFIDGNVWTRITDAAMGTTALTPVWQPFFGSDGANFATIIESEENPRLGRFQFSAPKNAATNSFTGYLATGWTFDPSQVGNDPMGMGPDDPTVSQRVTNLADGATGIFAEDDLEIDSLPSTFSFSIEARFADRRPPTDIVNGAKNGLTICVTANPGAFAAPSQGNPLGFYMPGDIGFDSPDDLQFLGDSQGTGGFEVFIENDSQPGLNIGIRPAGSFPGGTDDMSMRLEPGQKFDGRISITYTNDNVSTNNNSASVSFVTQQGQIFFAELTDVFTESTNFVDDTDAELRTYFSVVRPSLFIGCVSTRSKQDFNAKQTYFDNFTMGRLSNAFDGNAMPTPVTTDLDGDGDTDVVDAAAALDSAIPVGDDVLRAIVTSIDPSLNPQVYLKDRQYFRAIGRWYKKNVLPVFAGQRSQKEKRTDRRRLKGLRNTF